MSGTATAWCVFAPGEGWQVAGVHSCGQHSPGKFISLSVKELDVVPETDSSGCVMWGMRWIVSSCQDLPPWPCCLVSRDIMEQATFSVPSCWRAREGVAAALTAELQMLSQG